MSDLAAVACYGRPSRNSGAPMRLDLLGELLVGGSGLWIFRRLREEGPEVRLRSNADTATEVRAGFALSGLFPPAVAEVEKFLGRDWAKGDVDVPPAVVRQLAGLVTDVEVAVVLTDLGSGTFEPADWTATNWSVIVAGTVGQRLSDQWG